MPYVNIQVTDEQVTVEEKSELIRLTTDMLKTVLNKDPASTYVVINEVSTDNWGVAGKSVTELRKKT